MNPIQYSIRREMAAAVVDELNLSPEWELEYCKRLCELANMTFEWRNATDANFETVVNAAAAFFGYKLY